MPSDFDIAAKSYDTVFTFSEIGKAQRHRVHQFLNSTIFSSEEVSEENRCLHILEVNCGTGEDAVFLSEKGHKVIATDISEAMINEAEAKHSAKGIRFVTMDINELTPQTFPQKFDIIFSNFGGFNCLSPKLLQEFLKKAPELLNPEGLLVMVIMPKHCLWEQLYFISKGSFKKAFRRKTAKPILANVEGVSVPTWYYNPQDIVTLTRDNFKKTDLKPIGIAIPPSYLEPFFKSKKGMLRTLKKVERLFYYSFWAKYADHYIITLRTR